jgi:hypothetical protein
MKLIYIDEDALQDDATGDAAGVPSAEAGGPRHAREVHRDQCTQPLLERQRGEATTAAVRPEEVLAESVEPETPPAEPARPGQPQPESERFDSNPPHQKSPAEPAERPGSGSPCPNVPNKKHHQRDHQRNDAVSQSSRRAVTEPTITSSPHDYADDDRSTLRVHLELDPQHDETTTPSGGGTTSSGAQHTPVNQCGSVVRQKVLYACQDDTHGQPNQSKPISFTILFATIVTCYQFLPDACNLFFDCYQVFNSLNLYSIFTICSESVFNFVNQCSINSIAVNCLKFLSLCLLIRLRQNIVRASCFSLS